MPDLAEWASSSGEVSQAELDAVAADLLAHETTGDTAHGGLASQAELDTEAGARAAHGALGALADGPHGLPALGADGLGWVRQGGALVAVNLATQAELDAVAGAAAGGVLSGNYPNPGFAADMATQAELDAHAALTGTAHRLPIVNALPGAPTAGDEIMLQTAAMAALPSPIAWRLYFDGAAWVPVGPVALFASVDAAQVTNAASAAYGVLGAVGPTITVPAAGTYRVQVGARFQNTGGAVTTGFMSYTVGAAAASDEDAFTARDSAASSLTWQGASRPKAYTVAAGDSFAADYRDSGTNNVTFSHRWMRVTPVRLG